MVGWDFLLLTRWIFLIINYLIKLLDSKLLLSTLIEDNNWNLHNVSVEDVPTMIDIRVLRLRIDLILSLNTDEPFPSQYKQVHFEGEDLVDCFCHEDIEIDVI
jgi:hypothetical protein